MLNIEKYLCFNIDIMKQIAIQKYIQQYDNLKKKLNKVLNILTLNSYIKNTEWYIMFILSTTISKPLTGKKDKISLFKT